MEWLGLAGVAVSVLLFAALCFKGVPVAASAPLLSLLMWLFAAAGGDPTTFDGAVAIFASGAGAAVERYLLLFMLSALFGGLICETGIAAAIGDLFGGLIQRAPPGWRKLLTVAVVPLVNAVLTYSGVSLFVVVFAVVAIARDLFSRMDIPWHLYAMSMVGSATFTAGLLPGSPALSNLVPAAYLGTPLTAAPVLSLLLSAISILLGAGYMALALWRTERAGEGFLPTGGEIAGAELSAGGVRRPVNLPLALSAVLSPVAFINACGLSVELALLLSDLLLLALYGRRLPAARLKRGVVSGLMAGISPAVSLGAVMGFGNMLVTSPGFQPVLLLTQRVPGPPYVRLIAVVAVTSFLLGNANAGISSGLESLGAEFPAACGVSAEVLHRLAAMASTFGASPHSSALCNSILVAKLTHQTAYRHYLVIGPVNTLILSAAAVLLIELGVTC